MKTILLFSGALLFSMAAMAQQDSTGPASPALKFDINYLSNSVYLGRKDSMTISYITPGISFVSPGGFYASLNASYLAQKHRIDLFTAEAGYEQSFGNMDAGASVTKFFYNTQSENVGAELTTGFSAYGTYDFDFLKAGLTGNISVGSTKPDYGATFRLEKTLSSSNQAFTITPAVDVNASTENYYDGYYQKIKYGKSRKSKTLMVTGQALNASAFKLMDYELSANAEYKAGSFAFYAEPRYAIPVNPAVVVVTTTTQNGASRSQTFTEKISSSFFATVGVRYDLRFNKRQ